MSVPVAAAVPALRPGDHVRVVAPSGVVRIDALTEGVALLERAGFRVSLDPRVGLRDAQAPYLAGDDASRLAQLHDAFADSAVQAVWCARGGYGAMRLLEGLDLDLLRRHPKLLVGFSDITALHGALAFGAGLASIHGPLVKTLASHAAPELDPWDSAARTLAAVRGGDGAGLRVEGMIALRGGEARGPVVGGNLSLLASLVGSPWWPSLRGALVFVEEVGESAYRIDRLVTQLELAGRWGEIAGLIVGDLGSAGDRHVPAERLSACARARFEALAERLDCPVAWGLPVGHGASNVPVPFGRPGVLVCDAASGAARLEVEPAVVAPV